MPRPVERDSAVPRARLSPITRRHLDTGENRRVALLGAVQSRAVHCRLPLAHVLSGKVAGDPRGMARGTRRESARSEEHTSELQSLTNIVCRLLLEKKKTINLA